MKAARSLFPSITLGLALLSLLVLGTPVSGFATEPHVCVNDNHIAADWENLGGVTTIKFAANTCGHTSNTTYWKFIVKRYDSPYTTYCSAQNNGLGYAVSAGDPYALSCPSLPTNNSSLKIRVTIDYKVTGSGFWMSYPNLVKNFK